jgi:hypothetical protein
LLLAVMVNRVGVGGVAVALTVGMAAYGAVTIARLRLRFGAPVPVGLLARLGFGLAVIILAGTVFAGRQELSVPGVALRLAFALVSMALYWGMLSPGDRAFVGTGFGLLQRRQAPGS